MSEEFEVAVPKVKKENKKPSFISKFAAFLKRKIMRVMWVTKVYFKERAPESGRAIYICNHYSKCDANAILSRVMPLDSYVLMKKEIYGNKFIAKIMDAIGGIPVSRGDADLYAVKKILKVLNNDKQVLIFPEGKRNPYDMKIMLPLKEGTATFAIKTKSPIIPCLYYRYPRAFRRNYLIIGKPFTLEQFYGKKTHEIKDEATSIIAEKFAELRVEIDDIVENFKGDETKYLNYLRDSGRLVPENRDKDIQNAASKLADNEVPVKDIPKVDSNKVIMKKVPVGEEVENKNSKE